MRRMMRTLGEFVRDVGSGVDAGHAIRLGLPVSRRAQRQASTPPDLPWSDAGPAQPGRVWPGSDAWWS